MQEGGARWLPRQCEICRGWAHAAVCAGCVARHAAPVPRCGRCGLRLAAADPVCGACRRRPPPFAQTVCAVGYAFPWDGLVAAFKFGGRVELAGALAERLLAAVRQAGGDARPHALVPVPLSRERLAARGYNQAWELARPLARALGCAAWPALLQRPLDTAHQTALDAAARASNLRGAFVVDAAQRSRLHGRHVALVDDVMTTGATLREAAAVLLQAGAARVDAWTLARTD